MLHKVSMCFSETILNKGALRDWFCSLVTPCPAMPAQAGIQSSESHMDSRRRGNEEGATSEVVMQRQGKDYLGRRLFSL